jgi:hypothetical protein
MFLLGLLYQGGKYGWVVPLLPTYGYVFKKAKKNLIKIIRFTFNFPFYPIGASM